MQAKSSSNIFAHIAFWVLLWISISSIAMFYDVEPRILLVKLIEFALIIPGVYTLSYLVIPQAFKGKYGTALLGAITLLTTYTILRRFLFQYALFPLFYGESGYSFEFFNWYRILSDIWSFIGMVALFNAIRYLLHYRNAQKRVKELQIEKKEAELQFLKAQIHPHFLFNTLNALYYEVLHKTDQAPEMVIQLSGILRFVLHESKNETISVNKELKLIRNYAELMQRRYGNRLVVEISNEITESKTVPPMIFFSIAENAFKHGISEHSEFCFVRMKLVQRNNNLVFISSNSFHKIETELKDPFGSKEGIGLENLTRQLDLYFGTEYTLLSSIENGTYTCKLQIPIDE